MTLEPMVPVADEFTVPCPYCQEMFTHKGTCRLSYANQGDAYIIIARRVSIHFGKPDERAEAHA